MQAKNPLVEIINAELKHRGWKPARLAKESGVAQPVISRLLSRGTIHVGINNIYAILSSLELIQGARLSARDRYPETVEKILDVLRDCDPRKWEKILDYAKFISESTQEEPAKPAAPQKKKKNNFK